jgi:hypothetical protein
VCGAGGRKRRKRLHRKTRFRGSQGIGDRGEDQKRKEGKKKRVGRWRGKVNSHFQGIRGKAGTGWGTSEATGRGCEAYRSPGGDGLGKLRSCTTTVMFCQENPAVVRKGTGDGSGM